MIFPRARSTGARLDLQYEDGTTEQTLNCVTEDWYFVMVSGAEDATTGVQTFTFRVTRYEADTDDWTLGSEVYDRTCTGTLTGAGLVDGDSFVPATDGSLVIGTAGTGTAPETNPWWGRIDDFAFWDKALASSEYETVRDCYGLPTPLPTSLPTAMPMPAPSALPARPSASTPFSRTDPSSPVGPAIGAEGMRASAHGQQSRDSWRRR